MGLRDCGHEIDGHIFSFRVILQISDRHDGFSSQEPGGLLCTKSYLAEGETVTFFIYSNDFLNSRAVPFNGNTTMTGSKTFDQLRQQNLSTDAVENPDAFFPHSAIAARVVFEPMPAQGHVRITARSESYDLLWGVTASPKNLTQHPVEVAFYDRLVDEAKKHLPEEVSSQATKSISDVLQQVQQLRSRLDAVEASLTPKNVSEKTQKRASEVAPKIHDALRLLDGWAKKDPTE